MASLIEINERMANVEEGDMVRWNGRDAAKPVRAVTDTHFEVGSERGGRYRFHKTEWPPRLTRLDSGNEWRVEEFEIVDTETRY